MNKSTTLFNPPLCSDEELYSAIKSCDLNELVKLNHGKNRFNQIISKEVNHKFSFMTNPPSFFYYACRNSSPAIVNYMIANGANVEDTRFLLLPIIEAYFSGRFDILPELVRGGANINSRLHNATFLHISVTVYAGTNVINYFLELGANPTLKNDDGKTAVDVAIQAGYLEKAKFIVNYAKDHLDNWQEVVSKENLHLFDNSTTQTSSMTPS